MILFFVFVLFFSEASPDSAPLISQTLMLVDAADCSDDYAAA